MQRMIFRIYEQDHPNCSILNKNPEKQFLKKHSFVFKIHYNLMQVSLEYITRTSVFHILLLHSHQCPWGSTIVYWVTFLQRWSNTCSYQTNHFLIFLLNLSSSVLWKVKVHVTLNNSWRSLLGRDERYLRLSVQTMEWIWLEYPMQKRAPLKNVRVTGISQLKMPI